MSVYPLRNSSIHIMALLLTGAIHGGVAMWALAPSSPTVLPNQQVVRINMIAAAAPAQVKQKKAVVEPVTEEMPKFHVDKPEPVIKETEPEIETPKPIVEKETAKPVAEKAVKAKPNQSSGDHPQSPILAEPKDDVVDMPSVPTRTMSDRPVIAERQAATITKPVNAAYLDNPPPTYPLKARRKGYEGVVFLDVVVKVDGLPRTIRLIQSSGYDMLDKAAIHAVRQWRFVPARRGSELVEASVEVPIEFLLN